MQRQCRQRWTTARATTTTNTQSGRRRCGRHRQQQYDSNIYRRVGSGRLRTTIRREAGVRNSRSAASSNAAAEPFRNTSDSSTLVATPLAPERLPKRPETSRSRVFRVRAAKATARAARRTDRHNNTHEGEMEETWPHR